MLSVNHQIAKNVDTKVEKTVSQPYSAPQMFTVGSTVELVQGPRAYSRCKDGYNRWYVWTY